MRLPDFIFSLVTIFVNGQASAADGVFTLLQSRPFVAEVSSVSTSLTGYKLSLRSTDGSTRSFECISSGPSLEQQFAAQLKSDHFYAFPQCVVDFLGLEQTVNVLRSLPTPTGPFGVFVPAPERRNQPPSGLLELGQDHPFRAIVLDLGIGETGYSIVLQGVDSELHLASGTFSSDKVKAIAEGLRRGETYEFPAALEDVLLGDAERAAKAKPKSAAVAVLGRYIGAWRGSLEDDPTATIQMNCQWLADGTGIWRELTFHRPGGGSLPSLDIARIVFDARAQGYLTADPAADPSMALRSTWSEAGQTFTSTLPAGANGELRVNTAKFVAEDRIEWKTVTKNALGKVLSTKRGSYTRSSKEVPPLPLPPPSAKSVLTAAVATGTRTFFSQTSSTSAQAPSLSAAGQLPPNVIYSDFFKLRDQPPFRARLTHIEFKAHSFSATLERADQRQVSIYHSRDDRWDEALLLAKRLTPGLPYDFPAVLADEYQTPKAGATGPSTDAMRALAPFIGDWTMHWTTGPGKDKADKITVRYFWTNDGTGLWREVHLPAGFSTSGTPKTNNKPEVDAVMTYYDPAMQKYFEVRSSALKADEQTEVEWDAKTQTYSLLKKAGAAPAELQYSGTRRIVSPDRIDFQSRTTKADGTVMNESAGYYQRTKP
ncbi:hypothetical protein [Prosthecobacter sp.]|uniref:hypothetical protein n=1 Tax=Prosthecobacter sp. TaxID=1965333 RepID=UPI0037832EB5